MRLWSIHPEYLDVKGLVAAWREGLLAQKVLRGETRGYTKHPQLERFIASQKPLEYIGFFLYVIYEEAAYRGYEFDADKIGILPRRSYKQISVHSDQIIYEAALLRSKLMIRCPERVELIPASSALIRLNPVFTCVPGPVEGWEKTIPEILKACRFL